MDGCNCTRITEPWAYTIGLADLGLPELVITGADSALVGHWFDVVATRRTSGLLSTAAQETRCGHGPLRIVDVPDAWLAADPSRMAKWFEQYGPGAPHPAVQQIVWPCSDGHFPGDRCDLFADPHEQPLLVDDPLRHPGPSARNRAERRQSQRGRRRPR